MRNLFIILDIQHLEDREGVQTHILKGEFILKCADDLVFDWIVQQRRF